MEEAPKKKQLAEQVKQSMGGNVGSMSKLLDFLIDECRTGLETSPINEVADLQGSIKGYRKLQKLLIKERKTS